MLDIIIALGLLVPVVLLIGRRIFKNKEKTGSPFSCSGCNHCPYAGSCSSEVGESFDNNICIEEK